MSIEILVNQLTGSEQWMADAVCPTTSPDDFFPEKGGTTRDAKRICRDCPVRAECLRYAVDTDQRFGIWGGLSERERRRLKRGVAVTTEQMQRNGPATRRSECGTEYGYRRHLTNGEYICGPCREAENAANRRRYAEKRKAS